MNKKMGFPIMSHVREPLPKMAQVPPRLISRPPEGGKTEGNLGPEFGGGGLSGGKLLSCARARAKLFPPFSLGRRRNSDFTGDRFSLFLLLPAAGDLRGGRLLPQVVRWVA